MSGRLIAPCSCGLGEILLLAYWKPGFSNAYAPLPSRCFFPFLDQRAMYYDGGSKSGVLERYSFDREYIHRLTECDPETQRHLVRYFGDLLSVKLRSRLRAPHLAEEVRQETFLRVFAALQRHGIEHPEGLGAFVNSVCNNVLLEMYRAEGRHPNLTDDA